MKLNLDKLRREEAEQMLAHYFSVGLVEAQETRQEERKRRKLHTPKERKEETRRRSRLDKQLPSDVVHLLRTNFPDRQMSPAFLEEMCAESETLYDLIDALKGLRYQDNL